METKQRRTNGHSDGNSSTCGQVQMIVRALSGRGIAITDQNSSRRENDTVSTSIIKTLEVSASIEEQKKGNGSYGRLVVEMKQRSPS